MYRLGLVDQRRPLGITAAFDTLISHKAHTMWRDIARHTRLHDKKLAAQTKVK